MAFIDEFKAFRSVEQIVRDALIAEVETLLGECTEPQRELFGRLYPGDLTKMPEANLRSAVEVCQRTVAKNRAGR